MRGGPRRAAEAAELDAHAVALRQRAEDAARLLVRELGAREVWLFGSLAWGRPHERSDVDLAVRGIPADRHYRALARASDIVAGPVDLVDLDTCPASMRERILRDGIRLDA